MGFFCCRRYFAYIGAINVFHIRYPIVKVKYRKTISVILTLLSATFSASSLPVDTYAPASALSSGGWRKVSVGTTGVHFISARQLASMGLGSPEKVIVRGYGAARIPDRLAADTYIDDLPEVYAERTPDGIYFYAVGPKEISIDDDGHITSTLNPYTSKGYYFLANGAPEREIPVEGRPGAQQTPATTYTALVDHEVDLVSYGNTGTRFFGEDFRFTFARDFAFSLPQRADSQVWIKATLGAKSTGRSVFSLAADGQMIENANASVAPVLGSDYGSDGEIATYLSHSSPQLTLTIRFAGGGTVSSANLDAVFVNYQRKIELEDGKADFRADKTSVLLAGADADTRVWDVTSPMSVIRMNTSPNAAGVEWTNDYTGLREYVAWNPGAKLPAVIDEGTVEAQNLHGMSTPRMVIITVPQFVAQAQRISDIHLRADSMETAIVVQDEIFNEFSSGAPDAGAYRRFLKMLYDRGNTSGTSLEYVLFLGRPTFDVRGVTPTAAALSDPVMSSWQSPESLAETVSFTTDDFYAFLEDNSGIKPGSDRYCIAVGRIPAKNTQEAAAYIDKLESYIFSPQPGEWHNRVIVTADDGDMGVHISQSDELISSMRGNAKGRDMVYDKVYIDAYPLVGGVCEEGRTLLHRLIDAGASWWTYTGHANKYYLSAQGIMTLNDLNNLSNRYLPVFFGATCYFMQWDGFEQSGAEKMFFRPKAGVIAAISSTRPVYISENSLFSRAIGQEAFATDGNGRPLPIGKIVSNAKNRLASPAGTSNVNKLRFALMGDPALRPAIGSRSVTVTHIDGVSIDSVAPEDIVLKGRAEVSVAGRVTFVDGKPDNGFNGTVALTLYDAEQSFITEGRDIDKTSGKEMVVDTHGSRLFAGRDSVRNGEYTIRIAMPSELADNFRPALMSLNARSTEGIDATGAFDRFYVFGSDENAAADTVPPVIEEMYINHPTFVSGDKVNSSPMLIARISDNVGINLSVSGIGRAMSLKLDDVTSLPDVAEYFTPDADGKPGGTLAYPLENLQDGAHSLTLRVYDTSGNHAEATVEFTVDPLAEPDIYEVYTDANPATVEANFYISHNRPDETLTVTIAVYNLMGSLVWSKTVTDRSDMFTSAPVTWNLQDLAGHRVVRGIYIYRAEISNGVTRKTSKGRRIAVTGR